MPEKHTLSFEVLTKYSDNATETGTTTTNVKITNHGLVTGDFYVNISRRGTSLSDIERGSRKITRVDDDNFTVDAIVGQTTGDTCMLFKWVDKTEFVKTKSLRIQLKTEGFAKSSFKIYSQYK